MNGFFQTYEFDFPLHGLLTTNHEEGTLLLAIRKVTNQTPDLVSFTLPKDTDKRVKTQVVIHGCGDSENTIAVGARVSRSYITFCYMKLSDLPCT